MPGETRVRIDCPDCGAPGAAWSVAPNDITPEPGSHANCPRPAPTPDDTPVTESANDEVTDDVPADATVTDSDAPPSDTNECPTCGATGSDPCVTASGNEASKPHAGRD